MNNSELLIESKTLRESVIERIEVLDKVKKLIMLPDDINTTIELAADFYEVDAEIIKKTIQRNKEELLTDGLQVIKGKELRDLKSMSAIPKNTPSLTLIPRRALLRIGMLLQDSSVAIEVRTQLLDQEQAKPVNDFSSLSPQLQFMIQMEQRTNDLENKQLELNQTVRHLSLVVDNEIWITDHQRAEIKQSVLSRVGKLKRQGLDAHFQGAFSDLNKFFGVPKYDKIKRVDFEQAMDFVSGWYPKKKAINN
ncbi:ORF6C domain-containing protein [Paenibacillus provencensis]|uniref:ORF6C domain-containing protein n=1 Tax=Paenibacillus provencensis TaxID=441151 RepID=A0ABW3PS70_9BACL